MGQVESVINKNKVAAEIGFVQRHLDNLHHTARRFNGEMRRAYRLMWWLVISKMMLAAAITALAVAFFLGYK